MKSKLKKNVIYNCPFCDTEHEVKVIQYLSKTIIKNKEVEYKKCAYYCSQCDEEFTPSDIMDANLTAAREAYRAQFHYLTAADIKKIRSRYELTQKEYARLLGMGDVTIQRYETNAVQDITYDNLMRLTDENPTYCLTLLERNSSSFERNRYEQIKRAIIYQIKLYGEDFFLESAIKASHADYLEESDKNGFTLLNLPKLKKMLVYFATYITSLYKVKLMKLLWYADAESYKQYGHSMSGLVYRHLPLGAVPICHNELMGLSCLLVEEEIRDYYTAYKIRPNADIDIKGFTLEELGILQKVTEKFKSYSTKEIVDYMHNENAYKCTSDKEIICFCPENIINAF